MSSESGVAEQMPTGRRERKKAATRQAIADAALALFLGRGFDAVSVKEIAETADVSVTTLFKHFPSKESLVFDEELVKEHHLVAAVRDRSPGSSVVTALRDYMLRERVDAVRGAPEFVRFNQLVESTPALGAYAEGMWMRHQAALEEELLRATGASAEACRALARFVLDAAASARSNPDPRAYLRSAFRILELGWSSRSS